MKQFLCLLFCSALWVTAAVAQDAPYKVVFDLTSRDTLDQRAVMRWVKGIVESNPKAEVEVVMYGKGFELVMPERSTFMAEVKEAMQHPNVSFKACEVALKHNKVEKSALLKDVQTVPDGIYEIIEKQHQGWGYIKVVH